MAAHSSKQQHLLLLLLLVAILCAAQAATQPNPNCTTSCGSVSIPFPFGTTEGCSLGSSFLIHCNKASACLPLTNLTVLNISLNGELRISSSVARDCYTDDKDKQSSLTLTPLELNVTQFRISSSRNKLTAVGCNL